MCETRFYKHSYCGNKWLIIRRPCGWGTGFADCPFWFNGEAHRWEAAREVRELSRRRYGVEALCPLCDLLGQYDRNRIRMVYKVHRGIKFGRGGRRTDPGLECRCSVM